MGGRERTIAHEREKEGRARAREIYIYRESESGERDCVCVCVCVQCDLADKMGQEPVRDSLDNFREFENVHTQRILFGMCHRRQQGRQIALFHARLVGDRRDARIGIHEIDGCVSLKIQHFVV